MEHDLLMVASDPNTSVQRLAWLAKSACDPVRRAILDNPNCCRILDNGLVDPSIFQLLTPRFSAEISHHPLFVLYTIIDPREEMWILVSNVIGHVIDPGLVRKLFVIYESSLLVRGSAAQNSNTPEDILQYLTKDSNRENDTVLLRVAKNKNTPIDVLFSLSTDSTATNEIRKAAKESLAKRGLSWTST